MEYTPSEISTVLRDVQSANAKYDMSSTLPGMVRLVIPDLLKALLPMFFKVPGSEMLVRHEQSVKAKSPISVRPLLRVTPVRLLQFLNALFPIVFTLEGIDTLFIPVPAKAFAPIEVTVDGMETVVRFVHPSNAESTILVTPEGIVILDIFVLVKASLPMDFTVLGIEMLVSCEQPLKAPFPMDVSPLGRTTFVILVLY